jgi:hypothetical protein
MYGNTVQASRGSTNIYFEIRTLNEEGLDIPLDDQIWPLVWSAHLVDGAEWVLVQFSGDGGDSWVTMTNVSAYTEYYLWRARPEYFTFQGRWRVIGVNDTNVVGTSCCNFIVNPGNLRISRRPYPVSGLLRFDWQGGVQGVEYHIEYSDDFGQTWQIWDEKYNGPSFMNKSRFTIGAGESQGTYTFEDRTSYLIRTRWYRIRIPDDDP